MKKGEREQFGLIRQYKAGYRKKPESKREVRAAEAEAVFLLAAHCPFSRKTVGKSDLDS